MILYFHLQLEEYGFSYLFNCLTLYILNFFVKYSIDVVIVLISFVENVVLIKLKFLTKGIKRNLEFVIDVLLD